MTFQSSAASEQDANSSNNSLASDEDSVLSSADRNSPRALLLDTENGRGAGPGGPLVYRCGANSKRVKAEQIRKDAREGRVHPVPVGSTDGIKVDWCHQIKAIAKIVFHNFRFGGGDLKANKSVEDWIGAFLPCWMWLRVYAWKSNLWRDVVAGLTVGIMVIPQAMSYAKLAGLPVQYGLYSALVPLYVYAVFGSSRHLAVGPVAITSLLLSAALTKVMERKGIAVDDPTYDSTYIQLAIQTSFLVAALYIGMALFRLGFITLFLSHGVVSGFTSGAAILIGLSQVKYIFGYNVAKGDTVYEILKSLFDNISKFNYRTFLMGMGSLAVLIAFKKLGTRHKGLWFLKMIGPLTVSAVGIVLVAAFGLQDKGIPIVFTIPRGLPPVTVNLWFPIEDVGTLMPGVVTIVLVGLMESIAIAKQLAKRHQYKINAGMELYGLGMSNVAAALFSGYPITGSFSRSAVNSEAGAQSQVSGVVAATLVGLVLLLLTSIFELLPMCIIGAIIISGVISLVDHPEAVRLWNFDKLDSCVWVVTFLGVLFLGAEIGLLCGVILSFLMFLARSAFPRTHIFGRLPGTDAYRSVRQYPEVESYPGCIVTGTDSPLYFLNAQLVKDRILRRAAEMDSETGVFTKYIVLDLAASSYIDTCALHEFDDWLLELSGGRGDGGGSIGGGPASRQLCLANPNRSVMRRMDQWGFVDRLGREYCFCTVQDAVTWCLSKMELEEAERRAETDTSTTPDTVDVQIVGRSLTVGSESASPGLDDAESGVDAPTSGTTVNYSMLEDGLHHRKTVT